MKRITQIRSLSIIALIISCTNGKIENSVNNGILEEAHQEMTNQKKSPDPLDAAKTNSKKIYVRYMPWFNNIVQDGYWGHH
jgi:hypothetical protein